MTKLRVFLGLVAIVAVAGAVFVGSASGTAVAKQEPPVRFEFSATFVEISGKPFPTADEITKAVMEAGNIGFSGDVGASFQVDSFFDITYRLSGDPDFDTTPITKTATFDTEMVALNVASTDPVPVIDAVGKILSSLGELTEYRGHVTVLK